MKKSLIDMLSAIKNGYVSKKISIHSKNSNLNRNILNLLYNEGYIRGYIIKNNTLEILLKYHNNQSVIREIVNISKPGNKKYINKSNNNKLDKNKIYITSNSNGISSSDFHGELLFSIK